MTEIEKDQLEDQLAQMTRWEGEPTKLWREALDANEAQPTASFWSPKFLHWRLRPLAAVIAIVGGLLIVATVTVPRFEKARDTARSSPNASNLRQLAEAHNSYAGQWEDADLAFAHYDNGAVGAAPGPPDASMIAPALDLDAVLNQGGGGGFSSGGGPGRRSSVGGNSLDLIAGVGTQVDNLAPLDRHVIRKATIELLTNDVRATFLKATQLLSEARSEYLEASSLTGTGDEMQASLTLRVTADRLSEVLNQLRQLGEVRSEDSRGEDVTSQVVDLDARLRNERRIETELLELLDKRDDAPLREILELRNHINRVRQAIERLTAEQQRLGRLVSLASILVIIRAEDAPEPEPEPEPTLGKYFSENMGASWTTGLRFLSDTVANLLRVLVGGVIWWVLLTVAILAITRHHRQAHLPIT
ncbi:MAG: DUF4349 domain-containing protein [Phycisphaerales bacterium]